MKRIIVAGCGTDVGKTVVSAILVDAFHADYWKPIQCGNLLESDEEMILKWVPKMQGNIHPSAYAFHTPCSPHQASLLENHPILPSKIILPQCKNTLIIESAGGVLVPISNTYLMIDLFQHWQAVWVLVSKNYLGSINHTLLTIEALQARGISIQGIIFNGEPNKYTEEVILAHSELPCLGRLLPEKQINQRIIKKYANQWKSKLCKILK